MKPLYKKYNTDKPNAVLLFNLVALLASTEAELQASELDRLCIRLVRPQISGALLLSEQNFAGNYIVTNGDEVTVNVAMHAGKNRVTVEAEFGTNTRTLAIVDIFTTADGSGTFEPDAITTPVVKQIAVAPEEFEEVKRKVDEMSPVYTVREDEDENKIAKVVAHATELSAGENVIASGNGAVASGYTYGEGSQINASSDGAVASGCTYGEGSQINASSAGAVASGYTYGANSQIEANGNGAVASGYASGANSQINASSDGAVASGYTSGDGSQINANGNGAVASGYASGANSQINASGDGAHAEGYADEVDIFASGTGSHAEGNGTNAVGDYAHAEGMITEANGEASHSEGKGTIARGDYQHVSGKYNIEDEQGDYALIVGNGTADNARSNAFAIDWNGNLVLFNSGTPVILTPAKLAALLALV